jgi:outer membrane protein OmpA-like peptidoglycan-associated protein
MRLIISRFILLFFLVLLAQDGLLAQKNQEYSSKSKKAIKSLKRAMTYFGDKNYKEAMIDIKQALEYDSTFVEAYLLAGQMYEEQRKTESALYYYRKAAQVNPDFYPKVLYIVGTQELELGQYHQAYQHLKQYLVHPEVDKRLVKTINYSIELAEFGIFQVEHPVLFEPINLGDAVNTKFDEYVNTVSTDEMTLIFTRKTPKVSGSDNQKDKEEEDFYQSIKGKDGQWQQAVRMSNLFNTSGNEGAMNISPDQNSMVFTACYREDGFGRCDLYFSEKKGKTWSIPTNMGALINTAAWESNPCFSSDGKTVYYVSNRAGGSGNSDIWTAELLKDGLWGNVKNLGNIVNSSGSEMTPYIHPDGKSLYFSSNGHKGMGGFDFYVSYKDAKENWSIPINLGYPINDHTNQLGLIINAKGNLAYISTEAKASQGLLDIYTFELYPEVRPQSVNYMKGVVADAKTKKPLKAHFELYDLNTQALLVESESDAVNGDFLVVIPHEGLLGLNVNKEGYLFYSEQFKVEGEFSSSKPFLKNVHLNPLQIDQKIVLENIFFASMSFELETQSYMELGKVKELLRTNPSLKIEISGHTDNIGSEADNLVLSKKRAKSVYDYLLSQGVHAKSLVYQGYGETMPIADNELEEGRAKNRRTELKVIGL